MIEERKINEINFHDVQRTVTDDSHLADMRWSPELETTITTNPLWANMKYYAIERKSRSVVLNWFEENCNGKRVLDYCCGNGDDSIVIANDGAKEIFGIDISGVSIKNCKEKAEKENLKNKINFSVMDAEALKFNDSYFDIATEYGALHHLDLNKAFSEIARVLKPGGKFICVEALAHNPIIHYYRKRTPHLRTEWETEHILRKKNIMIAKSYFEKVEILGTFHLFTLAAVPFRRFKIFNPILSILETLDKIALKLPILKWQAWQVVFVLSKPKKR